MSEENENIENFLRKGLENKEFQFREEDWAKLEARLDADMPPPPPSGMTTAQWLGLSVLLITVSFLSGWYLSTRLHEQETTAVKAVKVPENEIGKFEDHDNNSSQEVVESQGVADKHLQEGPARNTGNANSQTAGAGEIGETVSNPPAFATPAVPKMQPADTEDQPVALTPTSTATQIDDDGQAGGLAAQPVYGEFDDASGGMFAGLRGVQPYPEEAHMPAIISLTPVMVAPTHTVSAALPVTVAAGHKFAVGLAVSPDFSSTRLSPDLSEIGKAYGIFLEFHPLSTWRLGTGVFKADKVYTAGKGDYSPPLYSGWPGGVEPISTDAACDVLDIPLTAGFRLIDGRKVSFWLNGGISSYWMLSEVYSYHYDDYSGYRLKGWQGENENKHPFSVVSLSVSVETFVARDISLKIEPFFKAPLAGVGYGKVNLYTTGSFFSFRYHFPQRKGR